MLPAFAARADTCSHKPGNHRTALRFIVVHTSSPLSPQQRDVSGALTAE
jgi:hypothetical protein